MNDNYDLPRFPLEFEGKKGKLRTSNGEIEITDFKVDIKDNISAMCQTNSIPEYYSSKIPQNKKMKQ